MLNGTHCWAARTDDAIAYIQPLELSAQLWERWYQRVAAAQIPNDRAGSSRKDDSSDTDNPLLLHVKVSLPLTRSTSQHVVRRLWRSFVKPERTVLATLIGLYQLGFETTNFNRQPVLQSGGMEIIRHAGSNSSATVGTALAKGKEDIKYFLFYPPRVCC